jgi:hypothetical protein
MSASISSPLANYLLGGGGLAAALSGGKIYIYSGAPPANADAGAVSGTNTLLATVTNNGDGTTGLTFATPAANGVVQ